MSVHGEAGFWNLTAAAEETVDHLPCELRFPKAHDVLECNARTETLKLEYWKKNATKNCTRRNLRVSRLRLQILDSEQQQEREEDGRGHGSSSPLFLAALGPSGTRIVSGRLHLVSCCINVACLSIS
jgi:hypothetical protein